MASSSLRRLLRRGAPALAAGALARRRAGRNRGAAFSPLFRRLRLDERQQRPAGLPADGGDRVTLNATLRL